MIIVSVLSYFKESGSQDVRHEKTSNAVVRHEKSKISLRISAD